MSIHIAFKNIKHSDSVVDHVHEVMKELLNITESKFPFHMNLTKENNEQHHVVINCNYVGKPLSTNSTHENLYKAISKSVDSMKTQVLRKAKTGRRS
ncbi:MAG: HPF/RaiA family ribosome-associated protein [SAR324 cluster bacterium]|nr:HPF/RaiA family ribosome-associated protein [SAR324 cluster bacterium]